MTEHMEASAVRETADRSNASLFQSALEGSSGFIESASKEVGNLTGKDNDAKKALPTITIESQDIIESERKEPVKPIEKPRTLPEIWPGLSPCGKLQAQGYKIYCAPEGPQKEIDKRQDYGRQDQRRQNRKRR